LPKIEFLGVAIEDGNAKPLGTAGLGQQQRPGRRLDRRMDRGEALVGLGERIGVNEQDVQVHSDYPVVFAPEP